MYDFKGKVALVTGAARKRGIGHATAVRFAMGGADVVVNGRYRPPEEFPEEEKAEGWKGLDSVVEEIETQGVRGFAITADITDSQQVQDMVNKALAKFGRIDFLVANAGINMPRPFLEVKEEDWHRIMAVNLHGVFYCCQAVARHMVERGGGGAIVNVASRAGKQGIENNSAYCASKFAVNGLTQVLAIEFGSHNIRVNAVCPGRTITNIIFADKIWRLAREKGIDIMEAAKILNDDWVPFAPLRRIAFPEEIANAIVFLCSDEASFITGQSINVDGGRLTAH
jgi:NAD(P)-dependent dehydrogenase (short-subunit alcohol dehydrogenase family)